MYKCNSDRGTQTQMGDSESCQLSFGGDPEEPAVATNAAATTIVLKKHYIVRGDLMKYGFTAGCPAGD